MFSSAFTRSLALCEHLPDLRAPDDAALAVDLVPGLVAVSRGHEDS
jgi:hypothetical protein